MLNSTRMLKAGLYSRVSHISQAEDDRVSLSEQDREMVEYCESRNYEVVKKYVDPGYKGWSRHRPGFREMLADMETGAVDVVVMWHSDRLFRDFKPMVMVDEVLRQSDGKVRVESVRDYIDMDTLPIQAMSARAYIRRLGESSRMGRRGKARRGIMSGPPKYGYRLEGEKGNKRPAIYEPEAQIVRRIFEEYLDGIGTPRIAERLHNEGIPTRNGGRWGQSMIQKTLNNPTYIGKAPYGKTSYYYKDDGEKDVRHRHKHPESEWITIPYPPLIDERAFEKVQQMRLHPTRQRSAKKYFVKFLLKGLMFCGTCGRRY